MKAILFALFVALPMFGCGESSAPSDPVESPKAIDLDDKETREKIIAEAIEMDEEKFQIRGGLMYAMNQQTPYTGWVKGLRNKVGGGQVLWYLAQVKDGKPDGLSIEFRRDGSKKEQKNFKDGKQNGLAFKFRADGFKREEQNWKDGKKDGVWTRWWSDSGQKSEEINWKDDKKHGVYTEWYRDGTITRRWEYKDGERVD